MTAIAEGKVLRVEYTPKDGKMLAKISLDDGNDVTMLIERDQGEIHKAQVKVGGVFSMQWKQ